MKILRIPGFAMIAMLAAASSCGGSKSAPAAPQPPAAQAGTHEHDESGGMGHMCPMQVPGTGVSAVDTADGVAIVFTTSGDVAHLRQRVHKMAAMHEHMKAGNMKSGSGAEMTESGGMMKMVASSAHAEDIDGGARIVLVPKNAAQLEELRTHVRTHAERMASGQCPMNAHGA